MPFETFLHFISSSHSLCSSRCNLLKRFQFDVSVCVERFGIIWCSSHCVIIFALFSQNDFCIELIQQRGRLIEWLRYSDYICDLHCCGVFHGFDVHEGSRSAVSLQSVDSHCTQSICHICISMKSTPSVSPTKLLEQHRYFCRRRSAICTVCSRPRASNFKLISNFSELFLLWFGFQFRTTFHN